MRTAPYALFFALALLPAITANAEDAGEPQALPYSELVNRLEAVEAQLAIEPDSLPGSDPSTLETRAYYDLLPQDSLCPPEATASYPTVAVNGFFHLDESFFSQDAASKATLGNIGNGLGFRRARLSASGAVTDGTSYMMEYDFAQSQARFTDVWMEFAETPFGKLRMGRFRQPFGLAELTSIKDLPLLERPSMFTLAPFRQTGAMLSDATFEENMTWAVAGYRYLSDNFGNVYADSGGYGTATRLTLVPLEWDNGQLVHLGFDYSFNDPGRNLVQYVSANELVFGQNPNLGAGGLSVLPIVGVPPFVNTGQVPTQHTNIFGVEGAAALGSLVVQSEARWALLEQLNGVDDAFPAAYLHVRYVVTGERIPYNRQAGVFGRIVPDCPVDLAGGHWGAWELVARVSHIDLNGTALPGPGRRLTDSTIGLNWYIDAHTKFQFEFVHSELADLIIGDSDTNTVAMRGQLVF